MAKRVKRVIISVTNDIVTDQRVARSCVTLYEMGFEVLLIGRKLNNSLPLNNTPYKCKRMKLCFNKGPLFYAEFNICLFFNILFKKADLIIANDLDTLLASFLAHKIKKIPIVYDSHEYFTEVPELVTRPKIKAVWEIIEKNIFPKLKDVITVNDSIANLYKKKYNLKVNVIRNVPLKKLLPINISRTKLGLPENKKIILLQGAGININRGAEEAVLSMQFINNAILLIIGGGDVMPILRKSVLDKKLEEKVIFQPKLPPEELIKYTICADLGLTFDKNTNINYLYSLPNKIFDYIQAEIPILSSKLPEIERIIDTYNIGAYIDNHSPEHIASKITLLLSDDKLLNDWKKNTIIAKEELNWENEKHIFKNVYKKFV